MKWLRNWFLKRSKPQEKAPDLENKTNGTSSPHVLTLQIDKSGKIQTNIPTELAQTINMQTISQICKVMGYIAILEMQSTTRTLH
ncbi:MAG: hypothetical protein U1E78_04170 [Gammaproteobacteria bacterium]